jgi:acyl-CoA thioester hydrolase
VKAFPFAWPIEVRFRDLDGMGHVNNAVFFTYIEAARTEYLMALTGAKRLEEVDWIIASASLNFRKPVTYGDPLQVRVKPTKVGTTSFTLHYEIWNTKEKAVVAEGETAIVMFDYAKRTKKPIAKELREKLEVDAAW